MNFEIHRITKPSYLLQRPRVSYKVSEYVVEFINKNILEPKRIMQSSSYLYMIALSFSFGIPKDHKIKYRSPYSTDTRLYVPHKGYWTHNKYIKRLHLTVICDDINQETEPQEYAIVVYNMFADYLLFNFKSLKKEMFDNAIKLLDFGFITSFRFPATFKEQKYLLDEGNESEYIKHYRF